MKERTENIAIGEMIGKKMMKRNIDQRDATTEAKKMRMRRIDLDTGDPDMTETGKRTRKKRDHQEEDTHHPLKILMMMRTMRIMRILMKMIKKIMRV